MNPREQLGKLARPKERKGVKKAMTKAERRAAKKDPENAPKKRVYKGYND